MDKRPGTKKTMYFDINSKFSRREFMKIIPVIGASMVLPSFFDFEFTEETVPDKNGITEYDYMQHVSCYSSVHELHAACKLEPPQKVTVDPISGKIIPTDGDDHIGVAIEFDETTMIAKVVLSHQIIEFV